MNTDTRSCYEFGGFSLDTAARRLSRDGTLLALPAKSYEVLLLLVTRSGQIVEKDEFLREVWADTFVEEGSLTVSISLLRKTLDTDADGRKYIETIPRRGYRFVAPVKTVVITEKDEASVSWFDEPENAGVDEASTPPDDLHVVEHDAPATVTHDAPGARRTARRAYHLVNKVGEYRRLSLAVVAVACAALIAFGYYAIDRRNDDARRDPMRALAVLPFSNLKPEPETDFISYSLADAIIARLGGVRTISVRPSLSIRKYTERAPDLKQVAADLKVDTLLTGSYLKDGENLRVTAQMVDTDRDEILWQETFDVRYDNLLAVQDRVARGTITRLHLDLSPDESERLRQGTPTDPLAYEYYLRGVDRYAAGDVGLAVGLFERAVALDPNHARAWGYLGAAYNVNASLHFGGRKDYDRAQNAYERAISLNPAQVQPRIQMTDMLIETNRVEQAIPVLREALRREPDNGLALWELSYAYRYGGLLEESTATGERAFAVDANFRLSNATFNSYLYTGRYEKFLTSLSGLDESALVLFYRGFANYHLRRHEHALADFRRAYELDPTLLQAQVGKALGYGITGEQSDGLTLLRETEARIERSGLSDAEGIYKVAQAYAVLGDAQAALRLLRRTIEGGFFPHPYITNDPLLANIRAHAECDALIENARRRHESFKTDFARDARRFASH